MQFCLLGLAWHISARSSAEENPSFLSKLRSWVIEWTDGSVARQANTQYCFKPVCLARPFGDVFVGGEAMDSQPAAELFAVVA